MKVREAIEANGRDNRWEFSRPMLFDRTTYMSEICTDLSEMVEILDDFYKFLGPELKAVTGDTEGIDAVIARVQEMVRPVESLPFEIFDREHAGEWAEVKAKFYKDNEKIKVGMETERPQAQNPFSTKRCTMAKIDVLVKK
eukprot:scaffold117564_cov45-Prasinocladus_malaysianus.AAC.4